MAMSPQNMGRFDPLSRLRGFPYWIVGGAAAGVILIALIVLSGNLYHRITELRSAPQDNAQWALSQAEVDLLAFANSASIAHGQINPDLTNVRRRFDVFYSRITLLVEASMFEHQRNDQRFQECLNFVLNFLNDAVPIVDGSDAGLRAALPGFLKAVPNLREGTRKMSLVGVQIHAQNSDASRRNFADLLLKTAMLTVVLIGFLAGVVMLLFRQINLSRSKSNEVLRTTKQLSATVESSLDAVIVIDAQGVVLDFNGAAEHIFGYEKQEIVGELMADKIIPLSLRSTHEAGLQHFLETGNKKVIGSGRIEVKALHKSGAIFPVELAIGKAESANGPIFISYIRDISDRLAAEKDLKRALEQAQSADKAKSEFLAVMSHEMRTPLNGIFGSLEVLQNTKLAKKQREYVNMATTSSEILLRHVNEVLDISKIGAGKLELTKSTFDPITVLNSTLRANQIDAERSGVNLKVEIGKLSSKLYVGDDQRISQVIINLVSNAVLNSQNSDVVVRLDETVSHGHPGRESTLKISVQDFGRGISKVDQPKIFDEFFTTDTGYNRQRSGTGLGLTISQRIARLMGGDIEFESDLGVGSTFTATFQVQRPPAKNDGAQKTSEVAEYLLDGALEGKTVLIVEDNEINRSLLHEMLKIARIDVTQARNGVEAISQCENKKFDAILMDISMPILDGVQAATRIRNSNSKSRKTPIIALTAHAMPSEIKKFQAAGMDMYLTKPVRHQSILKVLSDVISDTSLQSDIKPAYKDSSEEWAVDQAVLQEMKSILPPDSYARSVDKFVHEIDEIVDFTTRHNGSDDYEHLSEIAHKAAGSAGIFGARKLASKLTALQIAAKSGNQAKTKEKSEDFRKKWRANKKQLIGEIL